VKQRECRQVFLREKRDLGREGRNLSEVFGLRSSAIGPRFGGVWRKARQVDPAGEATRSGIVVSKEMRSVREEFIRWLAGCGPAPADYEGGSALPLGSSADRGASAEWLPPAGSRNILPQRRLHGSARH